MQTDRLTLAGILCLARAALTLLLASLVSRLAGQTSFGPKLITALLTVIAFLIFVYIFSTLKQLLNERYDFHKTDLTIIGLIAVSSLAALLTAGSLVISGTLATDTTLLTFMSIGFGVLLVAFSIQLLRLQDNLFGFLKPYAFLSAAAGAGIASIKFAGVGVIFGAVADVLLAIIFIKASGSR